MSTNLCNDPMDCFFDDVNDANNVETIINFSQQLRPTDVSGKTTGIFVSEGTGDSYRFQRDENNNPTVMPCFLEMLKNAVGYDVSVKIDGENCRIVLDKLTSEYKFYGRYDWRKRVCYFDDTTFYPIFQKFELPKKAPKQKFKKSCINNNIEDMQIVLVGGECCNKNGTIIDGVTYIPICKVDYQPGEDCENNVSDVIYLYNPQIQMVDFVAPNTATKSENNVQIFKNLTLQQVMKIFGNPQSLTFENISTNIQGGKYTKFGLRDHVTTLTAHGIFVAPNIFPPLPLKNVPSQTIVDFVKQIYMCTLKYVYNNGFDKPPTREGIVCRFLDKEGNIIGRRKINQGHLATFAEMVNIVLTKERPKEYLF